MKRNWSAVVFLSLALASAVDAESVVIAEDDASQSAYGGSGFSNWSLTTGGNDSERLSGFFIADTKNNSDLNGIVKADKAFGIFANGPEFEQAVALRNAAAPM